MDHQSGPFIYTRREVPRGSVVVYAHCLSTAFFGKDQWKENLRAFIKTAQPSVPPAVVAAIQRQAPLALAFLEFSRQLREVDKQTPYPAEL